jgi:hypothetical protein
MSNGTPSPPKVLPDLSQLSVSLIPQTGMPQVYQSRSREIIYDSLQNDIRFVKNPFGPQLLILSRPNHRWN